MGVPFLEFLGIENIIMFIMAGLLLNMTPGPDTMFILGRTLAQGRAAGIASALGISFGSLIHTLAAAFGLSAILATSSLAFFWVKLAGAIYLIYLGLTMLRSKTVLTEIDTDKLGSSKTSVIFWQAVTTNVLNPKVALFFLAFLPQFVSSTTTHKALPFIVLGAIFVINGAIWCLFLVWFASRLTDGLRANQLIAQWFNKLTGALFVGLGFKLAASK